MVPYVVNQIALTEGDIPSSSSLSHPRALSSPPPSLLDLAFGTLPNNKQDLSSSAHLMKNDPNKVVNQQNNHERKKLEKGNH
jgi:hypothetical protein